MNVLENFLAGRQARREQDAADASNAMNGFLQQNGQALFNGDQNALGQLAGMGPEGLQQAFGIRGQQQQDQRTQAQDARASVSDQREEWRYQKEVEQYAAGISEQEAAAAAAQVEKSIKVALAAQTPEQFDALMTQMGQPDLVGQFENRDALAAQYIPMVDILKQRAGSAVNAPSGYMPDPANPSGAVVPIPGILPDKPEPSSAEAKLRADRDNGFINDEEYQLGLQRLAPKGSVITSDGKGGFSITEGVGVGGGELTTANTTDAQKASMAYDSLTKSLDDYEKIFAETGGEVIPGKGKDALLGARRAMQLQMKELFNLGVLNGPDLALMDALMVDPTGVANNAMNVLGIANLGDRVKANTDQLRRTFETMVKPKIAALGDGSGSPPPALSIDDDLAKYGAP